MCKVLSITGINDKNREQAKSLYLEMAKVMSLDVSHQDGLGYAAIDSSGSLFGEHFLYNREAFIERDPLTDQDLKKMKEFKGFLYKENKYNSFGVLNLDNVSAITLHTRLATSVKGLPNVHPFVEGDTSLVHNGIISNYKKFRLLKSKKESCDSEALLTQYIDNKVSKNITNFKKVANAVEGYYAALIFTRDKDGNRVLDVVKSNNAQLVGCFIKGTSLMVFGSMSYQLKSGCEKAGLVIDSTFEVSPSSILRINPFTNSVIDSAKFKEKSVYDRWENYRSRYNGEYSGGGYYDNSMHDYGYWDGFKWHEPKRSSAPIVDVLHNDVVKTTDSPKTPLIPPLLPVSAKNRVKNFVTNSYSGNNKLKHTEKRLFNNTIETHDIGNDDYQTAADWVNNIERLRNK